jgi:hypothetical protein
VLACSCNIRNWQRHQSDKGKFHAWILGVVAFKNEMCCMSSRAINIACARAMLSRHSVLAMFFCMRLEKHVCNAMSRSLLIHE